MKVFTLILALTACLVFAEPTKAQSVRFRLVQQPIYVQQPVIVQQLVQQPIYVQQQQQQQQPQPVIVQQLVQQPVLVQQRFVVHPVTVTYVQRGGVIPRQNFVRTKRISVFSIF